MTRKNARSTLLVPALLSASCLLIPSLAEAQFVQSFGNRPYTNLANPTNVHSSGDDIGTSVTIPFSYSHLGGPPTTTMQVDTNGVIRFPGGSTTNRFNEAFGPTGLNEIIAPYWDDLIVPAAATSYVATETLGSAPSRVFAIEYKDVTPFGGSVPFNFTVLLYEGSNAFEVHYGVMSTDPFGDASMGAEGPAGVPAFTFFPCTPDCDGSEVMPGTVVRVGLPLVEPELRGDVSSFAGGGFPNTPISGDITLINDGMNTAVGVVSSVYLSTDEVLDAADLLVGSVTADVPAGVTTVRLNGTVPAAAPPTSFVLLSVDDGNTITEFNEFDNVSSGPFISSFELIATDIVVDRVQNGPAGIELNLRLVITNDGVPYSGPVQAEIYLTEDDTLDAMDPLLITQTVNLTGNTRVEEPVLLNVPLPQLPPSIYSVAMRLDGNAQIVEADEMNNEVVGSDDFANSVDFFVDNVSSSPSTGQIGQMITVNATVRQRGIQFTGNVPFGIYLSDDDTYDPADQAVYRGLAFYPAANQANVSVTFPLTALPGEPEFAVGDYTIFAVIDPDNGTPEADEMNNAAAGGIFDIDGPNLFPPSIIADDVAFIGGSVTIRAQIDNEIAAFPALNWNYSYHLSDNEICRVTDPRIFVSPDIDLPGGESLNVTDVVPLPSTITSSQTAFVCIIADIFSEVAETNEADNSRTYPPVNLGGIRIVEPVPDFEVQIVATATAAAGGEELSVTRVVSNTGPLGQNAVTYKYYLSSNPTITPDDIEIGTFTIDLPPGADAFGIDTMTVPASVAEGNYYVGMIVDPEAAFEEVSADNNTSTGPQLFVYGAAIQFITSALPQAVVGVEYSAGLFARGGAQPITWSVESGSLPDGVSLDSQSGILSGAPSVEGLFEFVLRASSGGAFSVRPFAIRVVSPTVGLQVATGSLPPGFTGRAYATELVAVGGTLPYKWGAISALPSGLTLSQSGLLSGTPNGAGQLTINVQVQDSLGETASRSVRLTIANPDLVVAIRQSPLPDAQVGVDYCEASRVSFQAEGGAQPYSWTVLSGNVPGLTLDATTGEYCGTPEQVGQYEVVVRVQDDAQLFDTSLFTLNVVGGSGLAVSVFSLPDVNLGEMYSETLTAINGTEPYTWSLASGTLPAGITLAEDGTISGTPTEAGTSAFRVEVRDSQGRVNDQPLSITVIGDEVIGGGEDDGCSCEAAHQPGGGGASSALLALAFGGLFLLRRKNRKAGVALFVALGFIGNSGVAEAQLIPGTPYFKQQIAETYAPCAGAMSIASGSDEGEFPITLPFPFKFYDTEETAWTISANGVLAAGTLTFITLTNATIGSPGTPNGLIAPVWDDLVTGNIGMAVTGVSPNRVACIEWAGASRFVASATTDFAVRLYEGASGRVDISYNAVTGTGFNASMGMEDQAGGRGIPFINPDCGTTCSEADVATLSGQRITYIQDPGVELLAVAIQAPQFAFLGAATDIGVDVQNLHGNPVGPAIIEVQASTTPDFAAPITVGSVARTFQNFELATVQVPATIPTSSGEGRYYYRGVVDPANAIAEAIETNNTVTGDNFTRVLAGAPDVAVQSVTLSSLDLTAGGSVDVTYSIANIGGEDAMNVGVDIMLSTNPVISPQDASLGSTQVALTAGQIENGMISVNIPSAVNSGSYYIGVFVDAAGAIQELNESNNGLATNSPATISGGALAITTTALPQAVLGETYTALAVATGGDGTYTWSTSGTLPTGLGIVPETGQFFGRAGMVETQTFTVQVESGGQTASQQLTIIVSDPSEPLTVVSRAVPDGVVGQEYNFSLVATGGTATSSATWTAMGLPPGLSISTDGLLGGTPTETGTTTFSVTAMAGGESANRSLQVIIRANPNLLIQPKVLSTARFGEPYSEQLTAQGGVTPILWTLSDPTQLPDGIDLGSDGALNGTPMEVGRFRFQVGAFDSAGGQSVARDTETFVLVVEDVAGTFVVSTETLEPAYVGEGYEAAIAAQGGSRPYDWSIGRVPDGIGSRINPTTNELELFGAPTTVGTTNLLVNVTDSQGRSTQRAFALRVLAARTAGPITPDDSGCTTTTPDFGVLLLGVFALLGWRRRRSQ